MKLKSEKLLERYRVDEPDRFRLASVDCADTGDIDKDAAKAMLADDVKRLSDLQERLYAQDQWAVLVVLQGMDAAGKDGVIAHVMSGVNPQGCDVHPFKAPSAEELDHDFLVARREAAAGARAHRHFQPLPLRGRAGGARPSGVAGASESFPETLTGKDIWKERFQDIRAFERHLARNGTLVLKFFLHVSKEEQRRRFLDRLEEPAKRWKFSMGDIAERKRWDEYMAAYEDMIRATSRPNAPWYVVPADHKWFTRLVVAAALIEALEGPRSRVSQGRGAATREEMQRCGTALAGQKGAARKPRSKPR